MDAPAIKQALANLVDNAIKYSGERRQLCVRAPRRRRGRVEVADEGVGIPPSGPADLREVLSDRTERDAGRRGSGVGLALVKHIAEAHGGRVTVDSRVGEGSRFAPADPPRPHGSA